MAADLLPTAPDAGRVKAAELVEVRDRLSVAGLHDPGLGTGMAFALADRETARTPMVVAALRDLNDTKALLTRVFSYGDTASPGDLEAALGSTIMGRLAACNLVRATTTGELDCPIQLRPLNGILVASDRPGGAGDAVMPPASTTIELARAMPRPPLGRVLDLGTGSGVLALLAAATGSEVTATDVNERACTFARFNAAFNGLSVDVRAGDLFTPVEGKRFEFVLSQPPFVVQPPDIQATAYVHGGPRGDEVALRILAQLDAVLAPDGCALLRFDAPGTQEAVASRIRGCVPDRFDLGVFGFSTAEPEVVALGYAILADPSLGARYRQEVTSYSRHLNALGLDHFTGTVTVVHRPADERPPVTVSAAGRSAPQWPYITARLAAERLAAAADGVLLSAWLSPLPDARLTAELAMDHAELRPTYSIRYPDGAASADVELNEAGTAILQLFVGGRTLASAVGALAEATAKTPAEAAPEVLVFARDALRRGILVPSWRR